MKKTRNLFIFIFFLGTIYILFMETRLYRSETITMVKNLNEQMPDLGGLGIFASASSSTVQDARILEAYLASQDEMQRLDKLFHLEEHYRSKALDPFDRLYAFSSREDFFKKYLDRLQLDLDEVTGLLSIGFLHTDPQTSKKIVEQLIRDSDKQINEYNRLVAEKRLKNLIDQVHIAKSRLDASIKKLEEFQNSYNLLDPASSVQTQSSIIANIESTLVQKKSQLRQMKNFMSDKSLDVIRLKQEIAGLEQSLAKIRKSLASSGIGSLNTVLFRYERIKSIVDMNRDFYKAALLQLEQTKAEISQNSKILMKLTQPNLPDAYTYPQRLKSIFLLFLLLGLGYGILTLVHSIIKEH